MKNHCFYASECRKDYDALCGSSKRPFGEMRDVERIFAEMVSIEEEKTLPRERKRLPKRTFWRYTVPSNICRLVVRFVICV